MAADILERIVGARRERITREGRAQGTPLPSQRKESDRIVPFPGSVICEFKRRSPSRGALAERMDPVEQAGRYRDAGADSVSVLTEADHFAGSLTDLIAVKRAFPDLAVLRKDFLLDVEDVVVSWRAGADAVLLIAAILDGPTLAEMMVKAEELGLAALVEIHDQEDLHKVAPLRPSLLGINSRDLKTFRVDLLAPIALAAEVNWECRLVFESGVYYREDVRFAIDGGFSSILVGEAVVRDSARVRTLVTEAAGLLDGTGGGRAKPMAGLAAGIAVRPDPATFWRTLALRRETLRQGTKRGQIVRPLVKICGVTNLEDALLAQNLGADVLGLIYAPSPRTATPGLARQLREGGIAIPLVGVVVEGTKDGEGGQDGGNGKRDEQAAALVSQAREDLRLGHLSALQLHGSSRPEEGMQFGWPIYKAVRFSSSRDVRELLPRLRTPRFLIDAYHPGAAGGTGTAVEDEIMSTVMEVLGERPHGALWLAGGLNPHTVEQAILRWRPELIDASSGLEGEPGRKDSEKMYQYFAAIERATGLAKAGNTSQ